MAVLAQLAVVAASATGTTEVLVTFTRDVDAASVLPARFTIAGLMVSDATAAGNTVTLTTSAQTADQPYTVSVDSELLDTLGTPVLASDTAFGEFHPS